ncbi:hypothetical protein LEP1GSC073_1291 [Leptospira noguchii str. Cascata]|nr:hypothetical protein LEP1GSC073_1291 [Leptospira noguchii str. Cascata]
MNNERQRKSFNPLPFQTKEETSILVLDNETGIVSIHFLFKQRKKRLSKQESLNQVRFQSTSFSNKGRNSGGTGPN